MGTIDRLVAGRRSDGASDRRWVILGPDGRYVTLGRATDPSENEIQSAEEALRAQGSSGWLERFPIRCTHTHRGRNSSGTLVAGSGG